MFPKFASFLLILSLAGCSTSPKVAEPEESSLQSEAEAAQEPEQQEETVPAVARDLYRLGLIFMKKEKYEQGAQHWQDMADQYPDYPGIWTNLGLAQYYLDDFESAKDSLEQAIKLDGKFCSAQLAMGPVARELGDFELAKSSYIAAVRCDPNNPEPYRNLGILFDLYFNDIRSALAQYKAARARSSEKDELLDIWIQDLNRRVAALDAQEAAAAAEAAKAAAAEAATAPAPADEQPDSNDQSSDSQGAADTEDATESQAGSTEPAADQGA